MSEPKSCLICSTAKKKKGIKDIKKKDKSQGFEQELPIENS